MERRQFAVSASALAIAPALGGLSTVASAQGAKPVEGQQYVRLSQKAPVTATPGKVEVVEFFWYGCPHCFEFEPKLEAWVKKLPADVVFRRVPVAFRAVPFVAHQQMYYTLETMGLVGSMHRKVFNAIHLEKQSLDNLKSATEFAVKNGIDGKKFAEIYDSFGVRTKCQQASSLSAQYKIDGVPTIGIQGQFYTSAAIAGGYDNALSVADYLIGLSRKK